GHISLVARVACCPRRLVPTMSVPRIVWCPDINCPHRRTSGAFRGCIGGPESAGVARGSGKVCWSGGGKWGGCRWGRAQWGGGCTRGSAEVDRARCGWDPAGFGVRGAGAGDRGGGGGGGGGGAC